MFGFGKKKPSISLELERKCEYIAGKYSGEEQNLVNLLREIGPNVVSGKGDVNELMKLLREKDELPGKMFLEMLKAAEQLNDIEGIKAIHQVVEEFSKERLERVQRIKEDTKDAIKRYTNKG